MVGFSTIVEGLLNAAHLFVEVANGLPQLFAVAVAVAHVVGVLQVNPRQVGPVVPEAFGRFSYHPFVDGMGIEALLVVRVGQGVELVAIEFVVEGEVAGCCQAFAQELGTVVGPGREYRDFSGGLLVFQQAKNSLVVIVRRFDGVVPHVVLVAPGACKQVVVAGGRDGGRLRVGALVAAHVGPEVGAGCHYFFDVGCRGMF